MNNKKIILICTALFLAIAFSFFISSADFCCEKTISGSWCQLEDENSCDSDYSKAQTSCDETTFCQTGTCVNEQSGTCSQNTPKGPCEAQGGKWYNQKKEDIPACKVGCCLLGQEVAFVNPTSCQQLASDYGVDIDFRADINSQTECFSLDTTEDEGACVLEESITTETSSGFFENLFGGDSGTSTSITTNCVRTTASGCAAQEGVFNKGLLCTAQGLSDCAKSSKTTCEKDRVYFLDTCNNLANIYDEEMYSAKDSGWTKPMEDYWTEIKKPACSVGGIPSSSCGACSYIDGTICSKYKKEDAGMPNKAPKFGENVCRDLSCFYDTNQDDKIDVNEKYSHGESWCAQSPGTFFNVPVNLELENNTKDKLRDSSKYNLPGSRYSKLKCRDGQTIQEDCKDYRNSICKETTSTNGFQQAACVGNAAKLCPGIETRNDCEIESDCKWIPGYRKDGKRLLDESKDIFDNKQGACYPLFSPGLQFWDSTAEQICATNAVGEIVFYEAGLKGKEGRKKFGDADPQDAAHKCLENCYAIPYYGSKSTAGDYYSAENVKGYQLGTGSLGGSIGESHLSRREGYYCKKDLNEPDTLANAKTGAEVGDKIDCAIGDSKDSERRKVKLFYTHEQWLKTIRDRTRSTGDCGYKPHAYSGITEYKGDKNSETIDATFQILKQKGDVKYNSSEKETIYKGDDVKPTAYREGK